MYGLGGGVGVLIFEHRAGKSTMHRGPMIIPNPNRHQCCGSPQGLGPHWSTHRPACGWKHISSIVPNAVKHSWGALCGPKLTCKRSGLCGGQNLVFLVGACKLLRTGCMRLFDLPGRLPRHLHPSFTPRACSFAHQSFWWWVWGCNRMWCEFVCGRVGYLLTKTGRK